MCGLTIVWLTRRCLASSSSPIDRWHVPIVFAARTATLCDRTIRYSSGACARRLYCVAEQLKAVVLTILCFTGKP